MFFSMGVSIPVTPPRMSGNLAGLENQFCVKTFARMSLTNELKYANQTKCEIKSIKICLQPDCVIYVIMRRRIDGEILHKY